MARIGVVTIDLGGHYRPAERLAAALVRLGHHVMMWAPERRAEEIRQLGAEPVRHEPTPLTSPWGDLPTFAARQARATVECLPGLLRDLLEARVDVVVTDVHTPWGRVAAEYLGLPLVVSNPLFPYWAPTAPGKADGKRKSWRTADHFAARQAVLAQWGIDLGPPRQTVGVGSRTTVCFSTHAILGGMPPRDWCLAGPLMPVLPRAPAGERPLVYAALGTYTNVWRKPFATIIAALADLDLDAVVATGGKLTAADLAPLPDNVMVEEWIDSRAMLARAGVHVTHGGCGSVHESLVAGVPMVCVPISGDQRNWSARVVACGAGEQCRYEQPEIRAAVMRQLSSDGGGAAARRVADELRAYPGDELVGELFDAVLAEEYGQDVGGSGFSSSSLSAAGRRPSATGTS